MRASEYPIPDYAAYLWHRGDGLMLALPDANDAEGQMLFIPLTKLDAGEAPGWKFLLHTLAQRRSAVQRGEHIKFATNAKPTAQMLEAALKASHVRETVDVVEEDIFAETTTEETDECV